MYVDPADFEAENVPSSALGTGVSEDEASKEDVKDEKDEKDDEPLEEVESHDFETQLTREGSDRAAENGTLEKAPSLKRQTTRKSTKSQKDRDPNMVSWNGPDDPESPKNWKTSRKWLAVVVVSSFVRQTNS